MLNEKHSGCAIEMLESRRMMDGTIPVDPGVVSGLLGGGQAAVLVVMEDPNDRPTLFTPGGNAVALPIASVRGMLGAIGDPND
jgi:hypothetical protein